LVREASDLLREDRAQPFPPAHQERVWRGLLDRVDREAVVTRRPWTAAAVALALGVAIFIGLRLDREADTALHTSATTRVGWDTPTQLRLDAGELSGTATAELRIITPHVTVVVTPGSRFLAQVVSAQTIVSVHEGRARIERAGQPEQLVKAGGRVELGALFPLPRTACLPAPTPSERLACLEKLSSGSGLAAQNALFSLAVLAKDERGDSAAAIAYWRTYQARFPDGVLAPEASFGIVSELFAARRCAEALEEARAYQRRFSNEPRQAEVKAVEEACQAATPLP
jgi:hypothetical protein